eukprot:CAMPEP_0196574842 /NCGR_PEP_ID=MMETSP1081-20130531/4465_1 /TAXON_ID=36882 /ORGANISM="Pyramimonas amylifera, Strain CCMP720" /LENGTH=68 /DNA_ID=CAMNT_0041892973 /DNA_START=58 /DNA_END=265 /DNA_ORIENTATION=-
MAVLNCITSCVMEAYQEGFITPEEERADLIGFVHPRDQGDLHGFLDTREDTAPAVRNGTADCPSSEGG